MALDEYLDEYEKMYIRMQKGNGVTSLKKGTSCASTRG